MSHLVTYEPAGGPLVTVYRSGGELGVAVAELDEDLLLVAQSISDLAPAREPNEEEEAFGIESLDPPQGKTTLGEQRLIDIAVRATQAAIEATGSLDAAGAIVVAQKVQHAVRSALALLPEETVSTGIGTVYTP